MFRFSRFSWLVAISFALLNFFSSLRCCYDVFRIKCIIRVAAMFDIQPFAKLIHSYHNR